MSRNSSEETLSSIDRFSEPSDEALLTLTDVTAGYGNTEVIFDVDLHVEPGETVTLIGPNGAGKSTVMKSIYGFATVHEGTVTFDGEDITRSSPQESLRRGMVYILQQSSIFPRMTVHENLMMGGFVLNDDGRVRELVEDTYRQFERLADHRDQDAKTLSGGERRLLELARGLILQPNMILLDEPSLGLEPRYIDMVFDRIEDLNERGRTILLVEQNAEKGLSIADRGYVLANGELRYEGTGQQLLEDEQVRELYLGK